MIAFLEHLTPKAFKLDSKENLLKECVDLQERPLPIMKDPRENVFGVVLNLSSWKILLGANIDKVFFKKEIKYSLSLPPACPYCNKYAQEFLLLARPEFSNM